MKERPPPSPREIERALRALGLSRSQAKTLIAAGYAAAMKESPHTSWWELRHG